MARSSYIYTVCSDELLCAIEGPIAAFTVKHELLSYLRRKLGGYDWLDLYVTRLPDGGGEPTYLGLAADYLKENT